jgi:Arc/MetJ-type ribon-helix-helix transcriptional regulator
MQKVKDGYRASFRLNEDNPEHLEIYQMFQELMNSGKYRKESDLYRAAIVSLYREKQGKGIADERKAELQECARMAANEVREIVLDIINIAIADLKTSAIRVSPTDSDISSKSIENMGMKPPESSEVLPDDICDFINILV